MTSYALGIDIGGTFTDLVVLNLDTGTINTAKELTTHDDPTRGVIEGVNKIVGDFCAADQVERVVHATTLFTNALIERRGVKAGLLTTHGFRDTLEISRERKYDIYDILLSVPDPLVPDDLRREVPERILNDGQVYSELDETELQAQVDALVASGTEALAICFQNAFAHPSHEIRARELIAQWYPDLPVSLSHEVSPQLGEYERMSTVAANAYVQPLAKNYINGLVVALEELGIMAPFFMMLSNGGLTDVEEAQKFPVRLLESGPAAGVLSAASFGRMMGEEALIAFDMGGTTAKIALVQDNEPDIAYSFEAAPEKRFAPGSGLPINISTIELIEIGAGGGSIAHVNDLGLLKVGPRSAGSKPGPVCYGRGGQDLTVTDCDMIMGCLNPEYFAGGSIDIKIGEAKSVAVGLGSSIGLDADGAAFGVYDIVCENMAAAARVHVARHGQDVRNFSFFATGGAGPVHAVNVARKLGAKRVIIPLAAGVASALGLLLAPARLDRVAPVGQSLNRIDPAELNTKFDAIISSAASIVERTVAGKKPRIERFADMRYARQGYDITVRLPDGPVTEDTLATWRDRFESEYRKQFSSVLAGQAIEVTNIRAFAISPTFDGTVKLEVSDDEQSREVRDRPLHTGLSGTSDVITVLNRSTMTDGQTWAGPLVIEEQDSTVVVGQAAEVRVDTLGNLIVDLTHEAPAALEG
ncbi:hydantoinase/oxoprolinase family protein [Roseibium algae]|uniref:Hydantoinase/oxoprolinase family protein n=1 Tax=Roseibium algae TaxID=3123038 RepID=A0ABU8TQU8_9HYPH